MPAFTQSLSLGFVNRGRWSCFGIYDLLVKFKDANPHSSPETTASAIS